MTFLNTAVHSPPSTVLSVIDLLLKLYSFWICQWLHEATSADFCGKPSSVPTETRGGQRCRRRCRRDTEGVISQDFGSLNQNKEENVAEKKGCGDNIYWLPPITIVLTLVDVIIPLLHVRKLRLVKADANWSPAPNIFPVSAKLHHLPRNHKQHIC